MDKNKLIFVTGGTGFLGAYLLRYLVKEGYTRIRALRRSGSSMDLVQDVSGNIQWIEGDVLDPFSLQEGMAGASQVYHCAAAVSYQAADKARILSVNVEGTANVVNEALEAGIEKLVFAGSVAALGHPKEGFKTTETTPWEWKKELSSYAVSKRLAELEVWRGAAEGLNVCVINPSVILGAGRWEEGPLKIFSLVNRNFPICPPGRSGFVDVRDVAQSMMRLMESEISGERFIVSSENMYFQELMGLMAQALGKKAPTIKAGNALMQLARIGDAVRSALTGRPAEITRVAIYHSSLLSEYDNSKLVQALGHSYTPISETIQEAGALFVEAMRSDKGSRVLPLK